MYLYLLKFNEDYEDEMIIIDENDIHLVYDRASDIFESEILEIVEHGPLIDLSYNYF